jgi:hypothetical protein
LARQRSSAPAHVESSRKSALASRVESESAAWVERAHDGAALPVQSLTDEIASDRLMHSEK